MEKEVALLGKAAYLNGSRLWGQRDGDGEPVMKWVKRIAISIGALLVPLAMLPSLVSPLRRLQNRQSAQHNAPGRTTNR